MRVFSFHLMPYPALPDDYDGPAWVTVPNQLFDPQIGHEIYNRYLDELVYADELGFDGVCINEHHQNAYGLMPSPNLMASILARADQAGRRSAWSATRCPSTTRRRGWPRSSP